MGALGTKHEHDTERSKMLARCLVADCGLTPERLRELFPRDIDNPPPGGWQNGDTFTLASEISQIIGGHKYPLRNRYQRRVGRAHW